MWDEGTLNPINFTCNYFEGRLDGDFSVSPEMTVGFGAKLEIPEDKQNLKIADLGEMTFTFMAGVVPVAITLKPHLNLHVEACVEGKVTTGIKYEYANKFSAGVKYDRNHGGWSGIADYETTKNEFSFIPPRGTFKAEAAAGVLLACDVLVDLVAGPTLSIGPLVKAGLEAKLGLYDETPFTFKAGAKAGFYGRTGAKVKLWKIELFDWQTELTFGPEWDIWSYEYDGKDEKSSGGNDKLKQQIEEMKQQVPLEVEAMKQRQQQLQVMWNEFAATLAHDSSIEQLVQKKIWKTIFSLYNKEKIYQKTLEITKEEAMQSTDTNNFNERMKARLCNNIRSVAKKWMWMVK